MHSAADGHMCVDQPICGSSARREDDQGVVRSAQKRLRGRWSSCRHSQCVRYEEGCA